MRRALARLVFTALVGVGSGLAPTPAPALAPAIAVRSAHAADPFVDEVVLFEPGTRAGFGQQDMPDVVMGPPFGAGALIGSFHVVSLGNDGRIVLRFTETVICDGDGADFTVFENGFHVGDESGPVFAEAGIVAVSQDGVTFFEMPYDAATLEGLAGTNAVFSNPDNDSDPTDPAVSGGDPFDLADVGLGWAAYVRITDPGASIADPGNLVPPGDEGGFDLDAIAIVNECEQPPTTTVTTVSTTTVTSLSTSTSTSSSTTVLQGEVCGDGIVDPGEACDGGAGAWRAGLSCAADCTLVECGDPDDSTVPTASDALFVLGVAVSARECDRCVCDVDGSGGVSASDALRLLQHAVGVTGIELACPLCFASPSTIRSPGIVRASAMGM